MAHSGKLADEAKPLQKNYDAVNARVREVRLRLENVASELSTSQRATPSSNPFFDRKTKELLFFVVMLLACFAALIVYEKATTGLYSK